MTDTLGGDETLVLREFDEPPAEPLALARQWMRDSVTRGVREPFVASLATVGREADDAALKPSSRMVLVKEVDDTGFIFTTDASSRKGHELESTPFASIVFYWRETMQQLKVEGEVQKLEAPASDRLFAERPREAQATTVVSAQGRPLVDERAMADAARALCDADAPIPRPADWSGYRVVPTSIEFWQGRTDRLHRRLAYRRSSGDAAGWQWERLQP